jgi:two-component system, chemotaxis family, chemotaxis protein CheY
MKTLIVEDDFTSSLLLQEILKHYGPTNTALDGQQAVEAVRTAIDSGEPYDLVCLDIMMPEMDGHEALRQIRALEEAKGIIAIKGAKIVMTTALEDSTNILASFKSFCDVYLTKPVNKAKLLGELRKLKLIE